MLKRFVSASLPQDKSGLQYHINCRRGDLARYVLLPGDPARVKLISERWDSARKVTEHREFVTYTGRYAGAPVSCTSTGIGGPAAAIAVEELLRVGADTFIRVGTTGGLSRRARVGDIVISTGSVRFDGTSSQYTWPGYPALANYEVICALVESAESLGVRYHLGITASTDSFYTGQGRPGYNGFIQHQSENILEDARRAGILNFEMESATIFTLSNLYGARAGCVCAVIANRETDELVKDAGVSEAIGVANEAVKLLYEWDRIKKKKGKTHFYPSILSP
jgi:uridine phosphorylase